MNEGNAAERCPAPHYRRFEPFRPGGTRRRRRGTKGETHAHAWIRARTEMFFFSSLFKPLLFVLLLLLLFCFVLLH